MAIIVIVAAFGVEKGVERFNKILMPILVLLVIGICIYCMFLPNSGAGFRYYLMPDFKKFSYMTVVMAMGQLFFSLSIAMGIMITYGAYMRNEDNLVSSVNQVELFDTGVAFLAGLMIIPSVVAFGGEKAAEQAGVGLVFVTMPQVFASFPGGQFVGAAFFILVLFAAATSAISLLETNVHTLCQELKISRIKAIFLNMIEILVIGTVTILGYSVLSWLKPLKFIPKYSGMDILDTLDFISNSVLMPIGAIFTTVLVLAVIGLERICRDIRGENKWYREWVFQFCMCVIVIPCLLVVLLNATGLLG
jgi:NSS family neurotransmitter:Na+ symporter